MIRLLLCFLLTAVATTQAEPTPAALSTFHAYTTALEQKLNRQHQSVTDFIAAIPETDRLRSGGVCIEQLTPGAPVPGALLHHWRGTVFVPGATAADFEQLLRNIDAYPRTFAPQVLAARLLTRSGDHAEATMRIRQHHVLTVVLDTTYEITYGRLDVRNRYSIARSLRVDEIDAPGTSHERSLGSDEEHGFLWRQNTYWSYAERDGGLYMQLESVSLTRSIPSGLGWAVGPFVESVPRDSLEFTLTAARNALHK